MSINSTAGKCEVRSLLERKFISRSQIDTKLAFTVNQGAGELKSFQINGLRLSTQKVHVGSECRPSRRAGNLSIGDGAAAERTCNGLKG
jgi:hypothetical protein